MIQCGNAIRLTPKDKEDLEALTGFTPSGIRTERDLLDFFERCKAAYACNTEDADTLRAVFDRVAGRMLRERLATPLTYRRQKRSRLARAVFYLLHGPAIVFRAYFARQRAERARDNGVRAA